MPDSKFKIQEQESLPERAAEPQCQIPNSKFKSKKACQKGSKLRS
jgi:hypothetical protein